MLLCVPVSELTTDVSLAEGSSPCSNSFLVAMRRANPPQGVPLTQRPSVCLKGDGRQGFGRKNSNVGGIVPSTERAATGSGSVEDGEAMLVWLEKGLRVDEAEQFDLETGFFTHLAPGGVFDVLVPVDEPTGQRPAPQPGLVRSLDEDDPALVLDDADGHGRLVAVQDAATAGADRAELAFDLALLERGPTVHAERHAPNRPSGAPPSK